MPEVSETGCLLYLLVVFGGSYLLRETGQSPQWRPVTRNRRVCVPARASSSSVARLDPNPPEP